MKTEKLYIYIDQNIDVKKDGILSPFLTNAKYLEHYGERAKSYYYKDIIKWLDSTFKNRSKSISVLTEKIPSDIQRNDLKTFIRNSNLYEIDYDKLKYTDIIEAIYKAGNGKEKFDKVDEIDFSPIEWPSDVDKWGFTGIKHYQLVLKDGKLTNTYFKKYQCMIHHIH